MSAAAVSLSESCYWSVSAPGGSAGLRGKLIASSAGYWSAWMAIEIFVHRVNVSDELTVKGKKRGGCCCFF